MLGGHNRLLGLWLLPLYRPALASVASGFMGALAVFWNFESGVAVLAGLIVLNYLRFGADQDGIRWGQSFVSGFRMSLGRPSTSHWIPI